MYVYVRTTEETSEQHICWGDAEIEGFQLLDGKIQNVKQKHNICYMDIYDIIYMYIYIYTAYTDSYVWLIILLQTPDDPPLHVAQAQQDDS